MCGNCLDPTGLAVVVVRPGTAGQRRGHDVDIRGATAENLQKKKKKMLLSWAPLLAVVATTPRGTSSRATRRPYEGSTLVRAATRSALCVPTSSSSRLPAYLFLLCGRCRSPIAEVRRQQDGLSNNKKGAKKKHPACCVKALGYSLFRWPCLAKWYTGPRSNTSCSAAQESSPIKWRCFPFCL